MYLTTRCSADISFVGQFSGQFRYRQVVWNDWIQWMEIKKLGYKVAFRGKTSLRAYSATRFVFDCAEGER
jgi:hypothetical protein